MENIDGINIRYINFIMNEIYNNASCLYEAMVDNEHIESLKTLNNLKDIIEELEQSIKEEI
mgnify:CR=1 FL=1